MILYTLGHSTYQLTDFIDLLKECGVSVIADVRSVPHSRWLPQYNRDTFASCLKHFGIRYEFFGDRLGGKPADDHGPSKWKQGKLNPALISNLSGSARWSAGIEQLARTIRGLSAGDQMALMCSEADPNKCHRSLIAFELEKMIPGLQVNHLTPGLYEAQVRFQKTLFAVADERADYH